jgi:hypothetical protein
LVVPLQFTRVGVERDGGIGIEIVAEASSAVRYRTGVPGAPVGQVEIRVVRPGVPYSTASGLPGIARPGLTARLTRCWNGVKAPDFFSCCHLECSDEAADGTFGPADTNYHLVLYYQRSVSDDVTEAPLAGRIGGIGHDRVPDRFAGPRIDCDEVCVEGAQEQGIAMDG